MKRICFLFFFFQFFISLNSGAQPGSWTWLNGDSTVNSVGSFGIQGVASSLNAPPALYEAAEFKDLQGNFWFFGGVTFSLDNMGDLWKYDPLINQWTWIKGPGTINNSGVYGIQGVSSPGNMPSGRGWGVPAWVDLNGDLWIYGGYSAAGIMNDLWKYNIASNSWTWMQGQNTGNHAPVYGSIGLSAPANTPGSRHECNATWVDNNNNLWLFGGFSGSDHFNDLWKYDPLINQWTWMNGSNVTGQAGIYGSIGIPSIANVPGARSTYCHWKDGNGNFWLFGGVEFASNGYFNDMWMYNSMSNIWTWMSGSNSGSNYGNYGTPCIPSTLNIPPGRGENRSFWTDKNGKFWLYGGFSSTAAYGDLWMFNPLTSEWTFSSGDSLGSQTAVYGSAGIPNASNKPGARYGNIGWYDSSGFIFLFGGCVAGSSGYNNALWRYEMDPNCPFVPLAPSVNFYSSDTVFCEKKFIDFTDISTSNPTSWQWSFPGAVPASDTLQNPVNIYYPSYGTFDVTLIACNAIGCDTLNVVNFIREIQPPPIPVVTSNFDTLFSTPAFSYQWYSSSGIIAGAVNSYYIYQQPGSYYVVVSDSNGCENSSAVIYTGIKNSLVNAGVTFYPDPSDGEFIIDVPDHVSPAEVKIFNRIGKLVYHGHCSKGKNILSLDVDGGIYFLWLKYDGKLINKKFVVLH